MVDIRLIAQSAIRVDDGKSIIYFDPYLIGNNYKFDADYIFITHSHYNHYSEDDIKKIIKDNTKFIIPNDLKESIKELGINENNILCVEPNKDYKIDDIVLKTTYSYNKNKSFHKKENNWVGYLVNIDNSIIYVAGDTDDIKEIYDIKCDIACIPIGGTYTMDYKEAAKLINSIKPKVAIPTHYHTIVGSKKDAEYFKNLVSDEIMVRIIMEVE